MLPLTDIFQNIPLFITLTGLFVVGLVAMYGVFDKKMKSKIVEEDGLDDRIRALYKEESDAQSKKISILTSKLEGLEKDIEKMLNENRLFKDIFQGRDSQTIEFQKQGFEAMKTTGDMKILMIEQKQVSLENKREIMMVNKNVERLALAIEKHLKVIQESGGDKK